MVPLVVSPSASDVVGWFVSTLGQSVGVSPVCLVQWGFSGWVAVFAPVCGLMSLTDACVGRSVDVGCPLLV